MDNILKNTNGIDNVGGRVNVLKNTLNEIGISAGQAPGIGGGQKTNSLNQLPSTARVVKSASSTLMEGMSSSRGSGGAK